MGFRFCLLVCDLAGRIHDLESEESWRRSGIDGALAHRQLQSEAKSTTSTKPCVLEFNAHCMGCSSE